MSQLQLQTEAIEPDEDDLKLFHVVHDYVQSNSPHALSDAVEKLNSLYAMSLTAEELSQRKAQLAETMEEGEESIEDALDEYLENRWRGFHLWFWDEICKIAWQIPYTDCAQDKLVELVKALKTSPWQPIIHTKHEQLGSFPLWLNSSSEFPKIFRALSDGNDMKADEEGWDSDSRNRRQLNLRGFGARLMGSGAMGGIEFLCIWDVAKCLEGTYQIEGQKSGFAFSWGAKDARFSSNPATDADLALHVAEAAEWIRHGGRHLYGSYEYQAYAGGPLWDEKPRDEKGRKYALCPERWALWKSRFEEFSKHPEVDRNTRSKSTEIHQLIEEIEAEHGKVWKTKF
ncbi:hypothetical protein L228DRAFT_263156 [Xylona heveae TC161]|uniref:Uncharacterized protein n=1 Tax=Xylona heveae (strain CBS 132557 / TC161) TaxID=1328760 RepID=A0A165A127_XYLHT|nr:hypothetical protein L228DRAFT_263156 [Xylona heveae TC161]KZF19805.1 hypothetical protein L228DRAFT_263156 [Xylona heveae TC161]